MKLPAPACIPDVPVAPLLRRKGLSRHQMILQTPRLFLREYVLDDVDDILPMFADAEVMRYIGDGKPRTRHKVAERIARSIDDYQRLGFGLWAVVGKETGRIIGRCGLQILPGTEEVEIGWLLERASWGKGYAIEAARATIEYGFQHLLLTHIVAVAVPQNERSIAIMNKLGMKFAANEHHYGSDVVKYAITREEWEPPA